MKKVIAVAVAVFTVASMFTACKSSTSTGNKQPIKITACVGSEPKSIDPAINQTIDGSDYLVEAFEGLVKTDKKGNYVPGIAKSWDKSSDGLTYTFHLRTDAKWSDGKALTADDFIYAWKRAVDPQTASPYAYQLYYIKNAEQINSEYADKSGKPAKVKVGADNKPVQDKDGNYTADPNGQYVYAKADGTPYTVDDLGAKATDAHTVVVTLSAPCAYFLQIAAFPTLFPVRKDIVEANPDKWATDPKTYISDGPFMLKQWNHNSKMVFVRNPYYYDQKTIVPTELDFLLMDNTTSIVAAFKNKKIDLTEDYPTDELDTMVKQNQAKVYDVLGIYYYAFNLKKAPFDNEKVREALTLAIDRNYLVKSVSKGGQKPASAIVPPGVPDAAGVSSDFRKDGGSFFDTSASAYNSNVAKAKQLLAEAGYPDGKGFPTIEIKYNTQELHQVIAEYVQSEWKKNLGINVTVANEDWSVFIADRNNANYQVARDGWNADYNDPMTFLDIFTSDSGNNDSHYSNPQYDSLISDAKTTLDTKKRFTDMHNAEKILMNDYAAAPIYYYTDPDLVSPKLQGYVHSVLGYKYLMWASISK